MGSLSCNSNRPSFLAIQYLLKIANGTCQVSNRLLAPKQDRPCWSILRERERCSVPSSVAGNWRIEFPCWLVQGDTSPAQPSPVQDKEQSLSRRDPNKGIGVLPRPSCYQLRGFIHRPSRRSAKMSLCFQFILWEPFKYFRSETGFIDSLGKCFDDNVPPLGWVKIRSMLCWWLQKDFINGAVWKNTCFW